MSRQEKRRGMAFWSCFLPPFCWLSVFYFTPLLVLLSYAFMKHEYVDVIREFTFSNFIEAFTNPGYRNTLWRTLYMASIVTAIDLLLAFPVAYFLAFYAGKWKETLTILLLLPLWSSYLVRVFAWKIILGYNGILNSALVGLGILQQPSSLFLYNKFSMILTLCYIWLPFMVLPMVTAFERLPKRLMEASGDLGAGGWMTFRCVIFPLVLPGVLAGGLSVFSLTMGDYITPSLIGGAGDILIGNVVASQFGVAANWPLGAAFSALILLFVFFMMALLARKKALENL